MLLVEHLLVSLFPAVAQSKPSAVIRFSRLKACFSENAVNAILRYGNESEMKVVYFIFLMSCLHVLHSKSDWLKRVHPKQKQQGSTCTSTDFPESCCYGIDVSLKKK